MNAAAALGEADLPPCVCSQPFTELIANLDGVDYRVEPADRQGGLDTCHWAYCRTCRAPYPGHWRVASPPPRRRPSWPDPPARQGTLW